MREIKFRGKRLDNGEWIYGDLQHRAGGQCAIVVPEPDGNGVWDYVAHFVDPKTVGQCTGLLDKDVVRIYEGDIVIRHGRGVAKDKRGVVVYQSGQFVVSVLCPLYYDIQDIEVIGNIHDNPELLNNE